MNELSTSRYIEREREKKTFLVAHERGGMAEFDGHTHIFPAARQKETFYSGHTLFQSHSILFSMEWTPRGAASTLSSTTECFLPKHILKAINDVKNVEWPFRDGQQSWVNEFSSFDFMFGIDMKQYLNHKIRDSPQLSLKHLRQQLSGVTMSLQDPAPNWLPFWWWLADQVREKKLSKIKNYNTQNWQGNFPISLQSKPYC